MALTASEKSASTMEPVEPGVYVATCYGLIDLGTHHDAGFNKDSRKIVIMWEIPDQRMTVERDGKPVDLPRAISKRYTLSLSEKANLRRDLEAWRGRKFSSPELAGFDLKAILGTACQVQVAHEAKPDGKIFANIAAVMGLPKGTPRPKQENPVQFYSFEEAGPKPTLPADLPEWVCKIIQESKEWKAAHTGTPPAPAPAPTPAAKAAPGTPAADPKEDDLDNFL